MQEAGVGLARPDGAGHDTRDDVGRARGVVEASARLGGQAPVGGVVRHVGLAVTEEHGDGVGDALVHVVLDPVETVAHGEQLTQCDGAPRVAGSGPLGHGGRRVEVEAAVPHEKAHDRVQHGLGHGPAEQRGVAGHGCRRPVEVLQRAVVALGHDTAARHDQHGEGRGQWPLVVEHLVEQRLQVHRNGQRALRPFFCRPRHPGRLRRQRDETAHTEARKDSRAVFVSAGRSCCTQCPAPSTTVAPRKSGNTAAMASAAPGIMTSTGSSEPVRKPVGMV